MARIFLIICLLFAVGCTSIPAKKDSIKLGKKTYPPIGYTIWKYEKEQEAKNKP